jgi:hypothetical protein
MLGFAIVLVLLAAVSVPVVGLRGLLQYPTSLLEMNSGSRSATDVARGNFRAEVMPNLRGVIYSFGGGAVGNTRTRLFVVALLSLGLLFWSAWRCSPRPDGSAGTLDLEFALNALVALLVSFHL